MKNKNKSLQYRFESFGGIISIEDPPMLAYVDKQYMRELGLGESPEWDQERAYLSAPTEVHFSTTNACPVKCEHCYMDSGQPRKDELDLEGCKKLLDKFSEMGVFHIALGGGEAFVRKDFLDIVRHARQVGIVPNLTTNGYYIDDKTAGDCKLFGQVNLSINSLDDENFGMADKAIMKLKKAGVDTGINCVVSSSNYDKLKDVFKYADRLGLHDIELLRYKPTGRGAKGYKTMKLSAAQNKEFFPKIMELSKKYGVTVKVDCSFIPMICYHKPDKEEMEKFAVNGCFAGDVLLSVFSDGRYAGCSFADHGEDKWEGDVKKLWHEDKSLKSFRDWTKKAPEPCKSCDYLDICKGGCHVIAEFETGDFGNPDPGCPVVRR